MDELTLDGKKYLSSKGAAKITGYAKDYVGQLCREGRVTARLVGRSWYVLEDSIRAHRFGGEKTSDSETSTKQDKNTKKKESYSEHIKYTHEDVAPIRLIHTDKKSTASKQVQQQEQEFPLNNGSATLKKSHNSCDVDKEFDTDVSEKHMKIPHNESCHEPDNTISDIDISLIDDSLETTKSIEALQKWNAEISKKYGTKSSENNVSQGGNKNGESIDTDDNVYFEASENKNFFAQVVNIVTIFIASVVVLVTIISFGALSKTSIGTNGIISYFSGTTTYIAK